eukprot:2042706-Prymnesium_polylepis.1
MRNEIHSLDEKRRAMEDPVARLAAGAESSGAPLRWAPKAAPDVGIHGEAAVGDANQQFVSSVGEDEAVAMALAASDVSDEAILTQVDPELLAMLDKKQQRKLAKKYRERLLGDGGRKKEKKHKSKKEKKHKSKEKKEKKKRKRSDSDSDSDSSDGG